MQQRRFKTLLEALDGNDPDRPFLAMWHPEGAETSTESLTYGEMLARSRAIAAMMLGQGVGPGDRVILILPQGTRLVCGFVAALLVGAVPSILAYPGFKASPEKYRSGLQGVTANLEARLVVVDSGFPPGLTDSLAGNSLLVLNEVPALEMDLPQVSVRGREVAFIQHSAGTTGLQKGVALSHEAVLAHIDRLAERLRLSRRDRIASWLPLYHDMGLIACLVLPLVTGVPIVLQSPLDWVLRPVSLLELISRHRATLCWLPNFAFQFLARRVPEEGRRGLDLSSMRAFVSCSEPIRSQSLAAFRTAFADCGVGAEALHTSYALAENVFAVTHSDLAAGPAAFAVDGDLLWNGGRVEAAGPDCESALDLVSSGTLLPETKVRIEGARGQGLPEDCPGEILISSPWLFEGYYNRPDLDEAVLRDGWYRTGDLGFFRDDQLYVLGRKDDTLIVGGRNFNPLDIEEIAFEHAAIRDGRAVAFGIENPALGTQDIMVVAEVESAEWLSERSRIELEVRESIQANLGIAPRLVRVAPPRWIVKSSAGKPARSANREKFEREFLQGRAGAKEREE